MWLVVASEHLVTLLRRLARLISPNAPMTDDRSYPKLVAVPMESDKTSLLSNRTPPLPPILRHLAAEMERRFLADLFRADPPPLIPLGPRSDPLSQFFLEPLERGDRPS